MVKKRLPGNKRRELIIEATLEVFSEREGMREVNKLFPKIKVYRRLEGKGRLHGRNSETTKMRRLIGNSLPSMPG